MKPLNQIAASFCRIPIFAGLTLLLSTPVSAADGTTNTIALEGNATGIAGVNYGVFVNSDFIQLNDNGEVVYRSGLTGAGVTTSNDVAIWRDGILIAREGNTTSIAGVNYGGFSTPRINNVGQAAYWSTLTGTGVNVLNDRAIWRDGALIVREGSPTAIAGVNHGVLNTTIQFNNSGQVAYSSFIFGAGTGTSNDSAIWRDSTLIAREGNTTTISGVNYGDLNLAAFRLNDVGQVAYWSPLVGAGVTTANDSAIWRNGILIAREGSATGITGVNYGGFNSTSFQINNSGQVAYSGFLTGAGVTTNNDSAIWRNSTLIAREGNVTAIPGVNYGGVGGTQINDSGQVAYWSNLTGIGVTTGNDEAVWRSGSLITRKGNATSIAGVNYGGFLTFPQINNTGQVAYTSLLTGAGVTTGNDQAIFISDGIDHLIAARKGDAQAGSIIASLPAFTEAPIINDYGQIAYHASLADGREGVFLFTPDLHWRRSGSGNWSNRTNWTVGLDPAQVHDVLIDPGSNLTVLGPAGAETVKSLTIGGGAGTATLRLQPGALTATNGVTIADTGILTGNGTLNAALTNNGTLAPGNSPGAIAVSGDYTQSTAGTYAVEIGGLLAGTEYDVLNVSGTATLAGTLDVSLFDLGGGLFAPSLGDSFDILSADILSGQFDVLSLASLGSGLSWDLSYLIDAIGSTDIVRLSVTSAVPVPPAVWLFGSGLLGLIGIARRKR